MSKLALLSIAGFPAELNHEFAVNAWWARPNGLRWVLTWLPGMCQMEQSEVFRHAGRCFAASRNPKPCGKPYGNHVMLKHQGVRRESFCFHRDLPDAPPLVAVNCPLLDQL